jgi:predicted transcriptional regulator
MMSLFRLTPKEFRFRAGVRTELDRNFLRIVNMLSDERNLSEFIKRSVVEDYRRKLEQTELERLREEFHEIAHQFEDLHDRIQREATKIPEPDEAKELLGYLQQIKAFVTYTAQGDPSHDD